MTDAERKYYREYMVKWRKAHPERAKEIRQNHRRRNKERVALQARSANLRKHYGVTLEEIEKLTLEQGGLCKVCKGPPAGRSKVLNIDHCHVSKKFRGLLCTQCNVAIGCFDDNPEFLLAAATYLESQNE